MPKYHSWRSNSQGKCQSWAALAFCNHISNTFALCFIVRRVFFYNSFTILREHFEWCPFLVWLFMGSWKWNCAMPIKNHFSNRVQIILVGDGERTLCKVGVKRIKNSVQWALCLSFHYKSDEFVLKINSFNLSIYK